MDGIYQKNKSLEIWFEISLNEAKRVGFVSAHVDQFSGDDYIQNSLKASIDLFQKIIGFLKEAGEELTLLPILVVPLKASPKLEVYDLDVSIEQQMTHVPPSVYLVSRDRLVFKDVVEEYKCPIQIDSAISSMDNYYIYYRCFRDEMSMINEWEYNRAVYFEYYPSSLIESEK